MHISCLEQYVHLVRITWEVSLLPNFFFGGKFWMWFGEITVNHQTQMAD